MEDDPPVSSINPKETTDYTNPPVVSQGHRNFRKNLSRRVSTGNDQVTGIPRRLAEPQEISSGPKNGVRTGGPFRATPVFRPRSLALEKDLNDNAEPTKEIDSGAERSRFVPTRARLPGRAFSRSTGNPVDVSESTTEEGKEALSSTRKYENITKHRGRSSEKQSENHESESKGGIVKRRNFLRLNNNGQLTTETPKEETTTERSKFQPKRGYKRTNREEVVTESPKDLVSPVVGRNSRYPSRSSQMDKDTPVEPIMPQREPAKEENSKYSSIGRQRNFRPGLSRPSFRPGFKQLIRVDARTEEDENVPEEDNSGNELIREETADKDLRIALIDDGNPNERSGLSKSRYDLEEKLRLKSKVLPQQRQGGTEQTSYRPRDRAGDKEKFRARTEGNNDESTGVIPIKPRYHLYDRQNDGKMKQSVPASIEVTTSHEKYKSKYNTYKSNKERSSFTLPRKVFARTTPMPSSLSRYKDRKESLTRQFVPKLKKVTPASGLEGEDEDDSEFDDPLRRGFNGLSIDSLVSESEFTTITTEAHNAVFKSAGKKPRNKQSESHVYRIPPRRKLSSTESSTTMTTPFVFPTTEFLKSLAQLTAETSEGISSEEVEDFMTEQGLSNDFSTEATTETEALTTPMQTTVTVPPTTTTTSTTTTTPKPTTKKPAPKTTAKPKPKPKPKNTPRTTQKPKPKPTTKPTTTTTTTTPMPTTMASTSTLMTTVLTEEPTTTEEVTEVTVPPTTTTEAPTTTTTPTTTSTTTTTMRSTTKKPSPRTTKKPKPKTTRKPKATTKATTKKPTTLTTTTIKTTTPRPTTPPSTTAETTVPSTSTPSTTVQTTEATLVSSTQKILTNPPVFVTYGSGPSSTTVLSPTSPITEATTTSIPTTSPIPPTTTTTIQPMTTTPMETPRVVTILSTLAQLANNLTAPTSTTPQYGNTAKLLTYTQETSTSPVPPPQNSTNFVVYGLLPNNNLVRKVVRTTQAPVDVPFIIYGLYPNGTIVRRYPNGTVVPDEAEEGDNEVIANIEHGNKKVLEEVVKKDSPLAYLYPQNTMSSTEQSSTSTAKTTHIQKIISPTTPMSETTTTITTAMPKTTQTTTTPTTTARVVEITTRKPTTTATTVPTTKKPTTVKQTTTTARVVEITTRKPTTTATTVPTTKKPTTVKQTTKKPATTRMTTKKADVTKVATKNAGKTKATTRKPAMVSTTKKPAKSTTKKPNKPTTTKTTVPTTTVKNANNFTVTTAGDFKNMSTTVAPVTNATTSATVGFSVNTTTARMNVTTMSTTNATTTTTRSTTPLPVKQVSTTTKGTSKPKNRPNSKSTNRPKSKKKTTTRPTTVKTTNATTTTAPTTTTSTTTTTPSTTTTSTTTTPTTKLMIVTPVATMPMSSSTTAAPLTSSTTKRTTSKPKSKSKATKPKSTRKPKPKTTSTTKSVISSLSDVDLLNNVLKSEKAADVQAPVTESEESLANKVIQLAIERATQKENNTSSTVPMSSLSSSSPTAINATTESLPAVTPEPLAPPTNKTGKISLWVIDDDNSTTIPSKSSTVDVDNPDVEVINALLSTPGIDQLSIREQLILADVLSSTAFPQTTKRKKRPKTTTTTTTTTPRPAFPLLRALFGRSREPETQGSGWFGGLFRPFRNWAQGRGLFGGAGLAGGYNSFRDQNQNFGGLGAESVPTASSSPSPAAFGDDGDVNFPESGPDNVPVSPEAQQGLVGAAINVSRAVSQFMGFVIQGATQSFQNYLQTRTRALADVLTAGPIS